MKIVTWNVNGLRAVSRNFSGQRLRSLLGSLEADIICFQETKATREQLDSSLYLVDGYNAYFSFSQTKKGYSGVVTFCRDSSSPVAAEEGLTGILSSTREDIIRCYGDHSHCSEEELMLLDNEGRVVLTEHSANGVPDGRNLVVVNIYCPMYDPARDKEGESLSRLHYKMNFYRLLQERCSALEKAGKLVLAVGDFNCARDSIDSAYILDDPALGKDNQANDWIRQFTVTEFPASSPPSSFTLLDTFRYLHPKQEKAYTCWSTLLDTRKTNYGTRIDYILASTSLASTLERAEVWQHVEGSDHCPVFAEFGFHLVAPANQPLPSLCSCYFSGKQSKLSDFMTRSREVKSSSMKRPSSQDSGSFPPAKQTKSLSQKSLLSFSSPSKNSTPSEVALSGASASQTQGLSNAWKGVFGATPKAPLCSGHSEACVLRKVKKLGPNKDRQFWVCARPGGSKGDPQASCNYFKWAKDKKK